MNRTFLVLVLSQLWLLTGCWLESDEVTNTFANAAEVKASRLPGIGVIPEWLPDEATHIFERNNLDTNVFEVRFKLGREHFPQLMGRISSLPGFRLLESDGPTKTFEIDGGWGKAKIRLDPEAQEVLYWGR